MGKWAFILLLLCAVLYLHSFENIVSRNNDDLNSDYDISQTGSSSTQKYNHQFRFPDSEILGFCNTIGAWELEFGYFTTEIQSPQLAENCDFSPYQFAVCTLCFDGNDIWGIEGNGYRLFKVDYESRQHHFFGFTQHFTVLDFSNIDNILYGITLEGLLYSIARETAETSYIADIGCEIAGGCLGNDNFFYCTDRAGNFQRIDPQTGESEIITVFDRDYNNPLGFSCDRYTGIIYWMDLTEDYEQRSIRSYDPENDLHTTVGQLPEFTSCSALCIPSWNVESATAKPVNNLIADNYPQIELSWINPQQTVNNLPLSSISEISIFRDQQLLTTLYDVIPGSDSSIIDVSPNPGLNNYTIYVYNEFGQGAPKNIDVWFGDDMPGKVADIIATRENNSISLFWQPPSCGRHSRQWNGNVDSYQIICSDCTQATLSGNEHSWTHYPASPNVYHYQIIAENSMGNSLPQMSQWLEYSLESPLYLGKYDSPFTSDSPPFNTIELDGLFQCIYPAEMLRGSGFYTGNITALSYDLYETEIIGEAQDISFQIFIGETDKTNLNDNWILAEDMQLVYEGSLDFIEAEYQQLMIELDNCYHYNGGNLVILINRLLSDSFIHYYCHFTDLYEYPGCSRNYANTNHWHDPLNLGSPSNVDSQAIVPNVRLYHSPAGNIDLSGCVISENTLQPLAEVEILLSNSNTSLQVCSGYHGLYFYPNLAEDCYNLQAAKTGFRLFETQLDISGRDEYEICLLPASQIDVSGCLLTNEGNIVAGADVLLQGESTIFTSSDQNGCFSFSQIWGSNNYSFQASCDSLQATVFQFKADSLNMNLGNIVLNEPAYAVNNLSACLNDSLQIDICWNAIDTTIIIQEDFEYFAGGFSTDIGWGWGADTLIVGNGSDKLWGTALNGNYGCNVDYSLYSPLIHLDNDNYMLSFKHLLNSGYYNTAGNLKISLDAGNSWQVITPLGGYHEIMTHTKHCLYNEPVFTDMIYDWTDVFFDLSEFSGETVIFRFQFGTAIPFFEDMGWFIDDFKVYQDSSRDLLSYRIIKGIAPQIDDYSNWEILAAGLNEFCWSDSNWIYTPYPGDYLYGVQAEYTGGVLSRPVFSQKFAWGENYNVNININNISGYPSLCNLSLAALNGIYHYQQNTSEAQVHFQDVWEGEYICQIESLGYHTWLDTLLIDDNSTFNAELTFYLYPPQTLSINSETGLMQWDIPINEEVSAYNIYIDQAFLCQTTELSLDLSNYDIFAPEQSYTAALSALYGNEESQVISGNFTCNFISGSSANSLPEITDFQAIYPNPFNPITNFAFQIAETAQVKIEAYNIKGQKISTICQQIYQPGYHNISWDANPLASGIYFFHIQLADKTFIQKAILLH